MTRQVLNRLIKILGDRQLVEISVHDIRHWAEVILDAGGSKTTFNNYRRALQASFTRAISCGFLKENPVASQKPFRVNREWPKIVEPIELEAILKHATFPWFRDI